MEVRLFQMQTDVHPDRQYNIFIHESSRSVPLHTHDKYCDIFLTETEGIIHSVNGADFVLPAGTLCFVRPDDIHSMSHVDGKFFRHINFGFTMEIFERLIHFLDNALLREKLLSPEVSPWVCLDAEDRETLNNKIRRIGLLKEVNAYESDMYMRYVLMDIFLTHFCDMLKEEKPGMPEWLRHTMREMQDPLNFEQGVRRMVEISKRSINHLERSMKTYTGMSPREYINQLRIRHAASMLKSSDLNILDIVLECGFSSAAHFYKLFAAEMGMRPREYRKLHRSK